MQVEHGLAGRRLVELGEAYAICAGGGFDRLGDTLHERHYRGQISGIGIKEVTRWRLGDDEGVTAGLGEDVHHDQCRLVLENLMARDLATQDFGEDVRGVIGHGVQSDFHPRS